MRVVRSDLLLKTSTHYFKPQMRYVVSDYELDELINGAPRARFNWSAFASYERRYSGQDLNGKSLVVYRHNAWGDQLMASALPRYLKTKYPDAKIHMYCHPRVLPLWLGNEFVEGSAIPLPIPFEAVKSYDYHLFYEAMLEGNSEYDQSCCYDDMFAFAGCTEVPPEFKRPYIQVLPSDYNMFSKFMKGWVGGRYILYHVAPNNWNRAYPVEKSVKLVTALKDIASVIVVGLDEHGYYQKKFDDIPFVINMVGKTESFRDLIPFVENASLIVCPDSSIMHLAACFPSVPVISMWGLFHPNDRIKYYPNNTPIFHKAVCPHAPCHDHNFQLPTEQCKDAEGAPPKDQIQWCRVIESIEVDEVVGLAKRGIRGAKPPVQLGTK